jgi:ATP-dependent RNA helicase DeaD
MSFSDDAPSLTFAEMGLPPALLQAVTESGYELPTPIQEQIIPPILAGKDVVGQAQTGTGKTAAFALPLLARLQLGGKAVPQLLVLTPTRELALQVAESFETYGKHLKGLEVLAIFGGQDYAIQLRRLQRGVHVVIGTPGRVMDHIRRSTLNTATIHGLVLDEADEMLKMGFLDDVAWILEQLPHRQQTALFSATMPASIRAIGETYLRQAVSITIRSKTVSAQTVNQRCLITNGAAAKLNALEKLLEAENYDAVLVFVRTKLQTVEVAEQLAALGHAAAPLNGDIQQSQRLRTVEQLKARKINILVATDVAARGLDVERISHVINYDIPFDTESYIHRIGRTGRAGRSGEAILFVNGRERPMLKAIEQATRQKITMTDLPTVTTINTKRIAAFKEKITLALQADTTFFRQLVNEYILEHQVSGEQLAAALAVLAQGGRPLLLAEADPPAAATRQRVTVERTARRSPGRKTEVQLPAEEGMERYRIEIGSEHGIKPGNIVGAIANEADINSRHIGRIAIFDTYSTVDLPSGMPEHVLRLLQKSRVGSKMLRLQRWQEDSVCEAQPSVRPRAAEKKGHFAPPTKVRKKPAGQRLP